MRYFFLLLLLANIGFFVWSERYTAPEIKAFRINDNGTEKIKLISEIEAPTEAPDQQQNDDRSLNRTCYSAGPFTSEALIQQAQEQMNPAVLKSSIRKVTASQEAGYWVYLPAQNSRAAALKKGRELAAANVKDYYVVTAGDRENTISLGLYREPFNADNRITEMAHKGFKAKKEIRIERWPEFWLDYSITEKQATKLPQLELQFPNVKSNQVICQNR